MARVEDLEKGITSLEYRIPALAAKLTNAKSAVPTGDDPIVLAKQIALYGRVLDILRAELKNAKCVDKEVEAAKELKQEIKKQGVASFWR
jgi:hypothetical protein